MTKMESKKNSMTKKQKQKLQAERKKSAPSAKQRKNTSTKKAEPQQKSYAYALTGVWTIVVAVLIGIFTYSNAQAVLAKWIKDAMFGLFSVTANFVPIVILAIGIYVFRVKRVNNFWKKIIFSILSVVLLGSLVTLFWQSDYPRIQNLWAHGIDRLGGGFLGGALAILLAKLVGRAAAVIIVLVALVILLMLVFNVSFTSIFEGIFGAKEKVKEKLPEGGISETIIRAKQKLDEMVEAKPEKITAEKKNNVDKKEPLFEFDPNVFLDDVASRLPQTEGVKELLEEQKRKNDENKKPKKVAPATEEEKQEVSDEIKESIEKPIIEYKLPPIDLLKKVDEISTDKRREMYDTANKLMSVLKDFGVDAKLLQVTQGPAVTRYEIQPSTGVKLAKITGLSEDIALNLAVPTVLVAAVPGKAAVGIEVPNNTVGTVTARELMESDEFKNAKSKLSIALGKDIAGKVVIGDISKFPHILIAGSTGSGKSVCINTIITSILYKATPDDVRLIMIDPKVVELGVYNGIPHLLVPVVTDPKKAAGTLNWAVGEMMRRYGLFAQTGTRNLAGYNEHVEDTEKLPQIVIIIDELADLMMVAAKEVEDYICRLAQLARAAGIHLIIATQRPSVDVITGLIKANVPSRIAFAVSSGVDSRTILDRVGAEKLLGKGDMLYHPTGLPNAQRVQGAFVSDGEIESIVEFIKGNSEETHYAEDLEAFIERVSSGENGVTDRDDGDDADELLPQAIELAAELGQISTAMVQRKMKVGYARAGRIIDQMETRGLISGANGSKPRDVYLNRIRGIQEDMFDDDEYEEENEYDEYEDNGYTEVDE